MSDEKEKDLIFAEKIPAYKRLSTDTTLNEVREELDLPPIKHGDVSLNPDAHKKKVAIKPTPMITFERYFMSLGRPMHHKAGLVAYCNTKGKKTREAWKTLFEKY